MSFQSQQARLATLYLPLFGLLQENVYRLDAKESALLGNHSVSTTPSVGHQEQHLESLIPSITCCPLHHTNY